jgi:hypothetical protein
MFGDDIFNTGLGQVLSQQTVPQLISILDARSHAVLTARTAAAKQTAMTRLRDALRQAEARLRQPKPANVTQADWAVLSLKHTHGKAVYDAQATPQQFVQRRAAEVAAAEAEGKPPMPVIAIPTAAQVAAEKQALGPMPSATRPSAVRPAARPSAPGVKPPAIGPDGLPAERPIAVAQAGMGPVAAFFLIVLGGGLLLAATKKKKPANGAKKNPRKRR